MPGMPGPEMLLSMWEKLGGNAAGRWLFSYMAGRSARYSGSISPRVQVLARGHVEVSMRDTRRVRNHLDSIHAIAMANLGEMATGLGVIAGLPPGARAILKSIRLEYLRKARGTLKAVCRFPPPFAPGEAVTQREVEVCGDILDAAGDCVAQVTALWLIGPKKT
jgi:acyl-coenzyme A thioesterase PaaI-like protein